MNLNALIDAMMTTLDKIISRKRKFMCFAFILVKLVLISAIYSSYQIGTFESIAVKRVTMIEKFKLNHKQIVTNITQDSKICYVGVVGKATFQKKKIY
jgi:hypothetical protein